MVAMWMWACAVSDAPMAPAVDPAVAPVAAEAVEAVVQAAAASGLPAGWQEAVVGGADAADALPMIVVVHGRGDVPDSMLGLLADLPAPARVIAPRAPQPHGSGWSWFPVAVRDGQPEVLAAAVADQADALAAEIAALAAARATVGKPVITGFSQGGMLAFAVAVRHPDAVAKAVPIAGWLPPALVPVAAPVGAPPIRALHGEADAVLPLPPTQAAVAALAAAGWDATLTPFPGVEHAVPASVRAALFAELVR